MYFKHNFAMYFRFPIMCMPLQCMCGKMSIFILFSCVVTSKFCFGRGTLNKIFYSNGQSYSHISSTKTEDLYIKVSLIIYRKKKPEKSIGFGLTSVMAHGLKLGYKHLLKVWGIGSLT